MKKALRLALTSLLVCMMLAALCVPALADDAENSYVKLTSSNQLGCYYVAFDSEDLIPGQKYTFSCDINFGELTGTGAAFVNFYPYDAAGELGSWGDWASSGTYGSNSGWVHVSSEMTIDDDFANGTMSTGFWTIDGTFCLDNVCVTAADGTVVFSENFDNGFTEGAWGVSSEFGNIEVLKGSAKADEPSMPEDLSEIPDESQPEESEEASEAESSDISAEESKDVSTDASTAESNPEGSSVSVIGGFIIWIIIGAVVLVAAIVIAVVITSKKKKK